MQTESYHWDQIMRVLILKDYSRNSKIRVSVDLVF